MDLGLSWLVSERGGGYEGDGEADTPLKNEIEISNALSLLISERFKVVPHNFPGRSVVSGPSINGSDCKFGPNDNTGRFTAVDNHRSKVETVFSAEKRTVGSHVPARVSSPQHEELTLRAFSYNSSRLEILSILFIEDFCKAPGAAEPIHQ